MTDLARLTAPAPSPAVAAILARVPHGHLIGGAWQTAQATFESLDPATGKLLAFRWSRQIWGRLGSGRAGMISSPLTL